MSHESPQQQHESFLLPALAGDGFCAAAIPAIAIVSTSARPGRHFRTLFICFSPNLRSFCFASANTLMPVNRGFRQTSKSGRHNRADTNGPDWVVARELTRVTDQR